jgi:hypothetical protein
MDPHRTSQISDLVFISEAVSGIRLAALMAQAQVPPVKLSSSWSRKGACKI